LLVEYSRVAAPAVPPAAASATAADAAAADDALLLKVEEAEDGAQATADGAPVADKDGAASEEDSEDDELYDDASSDAGGGGGGDPWRRRPSSRRWALKVRDSLPCFGPGADVAVGPSPGTGVGDQLAPPPPPSAGGPIPGDGPVGLEMVVASGAGKAGALTVVTSSVRAVELGGLPLPGVRGVWAVRCPRAVRRWAASRAARNAAVRAANAVAAAANAATDGRRAEWVADRRRAAERKRRRGAPPRVGKRPRVEGPGGEEEGGAGGRDGPPIKVEGGDGTRAGQNGGSPPAQGGANGGDAADAGDRGGVGATAAAGGGGDDGGDVGHNVDDAPPVPDDDALRAAAAEEFPYRATQVPEEPAPPDEADQDAYVLLSTADATLLLATGGVGELAQVTPGDYVAAAPTLAAGNVLAARAAVQVTADGARLLHGRRLAATFSLPSADEDVVVAAQVADPYVLLRLASGGVLVLRAAADEVRRPRPGGGAGGASGAVASLGAAIMDEYGNGDEDEDEAALLAAADHAADEDGDGDGA
ncbi:hypothetical protein BU14_2593s0001, partial [Porphyra umbilicalis]